MSEVTVTVARMTDNELKPSDHVYYGIASLPGWGDLLGRAQRWGNPFAWAVGQLISGVLLAGGDDRLPVAVTGELNDEGTGVAAILYSDVVVLARASKFTGGGSPEGGTADVSVHTLRGLRDLKVISRHNYYDGVKEHPRHSDLEVHVTVDGVGLVFARHGYDSTPLTDDDAALSALKTLREHVAR